MNNYESKQIDSELQKIESEIETAESMKPIPISELMSKVFKDTEWLVEQLIPAESIVALSGAPAAYKTWIILHLALSVAKGDLLFDKFPTAQGAVLFIDEENGERYLQKRLQQLKQDYNLPIFILSLKGFKLLGANIENLLFFCKENNIKLVIFDSLIRIHNQDENDAMKMAQVFSQLKEFVKGGMSVLFTHHHRKPGAYRPNPSQDMRGSSDILASVDCHIAVDRKEDFIVVTQTKLRQAQEIKPFRLSVANDDEGFRFEFLGEVDEEKTKKADFKEAIKDLLEQEGIAIHKKQIFKMLRESGIEGGYSTFKAAVDDLVEKEEIFVKKGERNKVFCSLKPFDQVQTTLDMSLEPADLKTNTGETF